MNAGSINIKLDPSHKKTLYLLMVNQPKVIAMKSFRLFSMLVLFCITAIYSQEIKRTSINGTIITPVADQVEGIHIYNVSSQKGIVTDENGQFKINVAANDRLQVTSLQYISFNLIVKESAVKKGSVRIFLNPEVNVLDEVVIKTYDLTGDLTVDVGKIKTFGGFSDFDLSYEALEFEYEFAPDAQTSVKGNTARDTYNNDQVREGANLIGGVSLLTRLIFGKRSKTRVKNQVSEVSLLKFKDKFTNDFIVKHYEIPHENVADFVYFVHESDFDTSYLRPENELLLLDYMVAKSKEYLEKID